MMPITISLPRYFNRYTVYSFISHALDEIGFPRSHQIKFDFSLLYFIEPNGVITFSNLIEYLHAKGVRGVFGGYEGLGCVVRSR